MCGRYILEAPKKEMEAYYNALFLEASGQGYEPRFNAAPSQYLPTVLDDDPKTIEFANWGLRPPWIRSKRGLINIKAESLAEKPQMKRFLHKRCLIPATGFYEWKTAPDGSKKPHWIVLKDRPLFSFAGVWESLNDDQGKPHDYFAIITTSPNEMMTKIHTRMPVILSKEDEAEWLSSDDSSEELLRLLDPYEASKMEAHEITTKINNPRNDTREVLRRVN